MKMWQRLALVLAMLAGLLGATAGPASADSASELASCYTQNPSGAGPNYGGGFHEPSSGDWYAYSPLFRTLSSSACEDINLTQRWGLDDEWYRVRFYPSSGGSYTNSWKPNCGPCNGNTNLLVATDVLDNTLFRVETHRRSGGTQVVVNTRWTIAW